MSTDSTNSTSPVQPYSSPPITIVVTILLLAFFFLGFFFVYFCRCFMGNIFTTWNLQPNPNPNHNSNSISNGIDHSILHYFPTFLYSSVKHFRREKYGFECAICLSEFDDDDLLRLLIVCYHVFHQDCIDLWLESHKTCPVCRAELNLPEKTLEKFSMHCLDESSHFSINDDIAIDVDDHRDDDDDDDNDDREHGPVSEHGDEMDQWERERFSRSHTTGHSIIKTKEGDDKYTLRLLQHVTMKITKGHHGTESCITFGECYNNNAAICNHGYELGEVSGAVNYLDKV